MMFPPGLLLSDLFVPLFPYLKQYTISRTSPPFRVTGVLLRSATGIPSSSPISLQTVALAVYFFNGLLIPFVS